MKKPNREDLIKLLVRELIRREPDMAAHEADARYRVTHTSPGSVDTVRDLALNARVHDLISEEEYLRAAPNLLGDDVEGSPLRTEVTRLLGDDVNVKVQA